MDHSANTGWGGRRVPKLLMPQDSSAQSLSQTGISFIGVLMTTFYAYPEPTPRLQVWDKRAGRNATYHSPSRP